MEQTKAKTLPERLARALCETGVPFRVDAWKNEAPNQYGVVELKGQDAGEWADDHMIDQTFAFEITLYTAGGGVDWVRRVQQKLEEMDAGYALPARQWLPDIKKTAWTWKAAFYSPIEEV